MSAPLANESPSSSIERFTGGARALRVSALVGGVGLAATAVGGILDAREAYFSYLLAVVYWVGISLGALILVSIFNAANAKWVVVLRRAMEVMASCLPALAVLFVPILFGMEHLFPWVRPEELHGEAREMLHHKQAYLNVPFFIARAALYFAVWIGIAQALYRWSTRQDEEGGRVLTFKQRVLGAYALPFLALTLTFAAFDWMMSLHPLWFSTVFGVYYFSGSFLGAIAALTLLSTLRGRNLFGELVTPDHLHNLGKLLLAFTAFWAYIGFSQYMLIWIANLPEEITWYVIRTRTGWWTIFVFLILGHFVLPFFLLLSRRLKLRRDFLVGISAWLLFAHLVDLWWVVLPALHPEAPSAHWTLLPAFAGVGGATVAFGLLRARGSYLVPVRDPFLADSLRYTQP